MHNLCKWFMTWVCVWWPVHTSRIGQWHMGLSLPTMLTHGYVQRKSERFFQNSGANLLAFTENMCRHNRWNHNVESQKKTMETLQNRNAADTKQLKLDLCNLCTICICYVFLKLICYRWKEIVFFLVRFLRRKNNSTGLWPHPLSVQWSSLLP